ncbi:hypothetical protein RUND412_010576, partial [Rhizina undulata]
MAGRSMIVRTVEKPVQSLYPIALADKSWDNTGLLLEAPYSADMKVPRKPIVLLTIDLTRSVVDVAIKLRSPVIVTYHPIIFRLLKCLTCNDTQQESLLRLVFRGLRNGKSSYSEGADEAWRFSRQGGGMFRKTNTDLYFTGELSHHEALAANEKETSTITCLHSNTERGFLTAVMKPKSQQVLEEEWGKVDACERAPRKDL